MPAPPSAVITGTRAGTLARHLLFFLDHPLGAVRAWDGVGTISYGGNDYLGVGSLARVDGISDSRDLQNHEVLVTIGGVPYSALQADVGEVAGVDATITVLMLDTDGAVVDSRELFTGKGGNLRSRPEAGAYTITIKLRSLFADWLVAPRQYYVPTQQQRLYAGDNGFEYVKSLENATIAGWSVQPESTGSYMVGTSTGVTLGVHRDSVTSTPIGDHGNGFPCSSVIGGGSNLQTRGGAVNYLEDVSGANVTMTALTGVNYAMVSGVRCYVDINGDLRTPGGKLIYPSGGSSANKLRKQGTITSLGTAGATTLTLNGVAPAVYKKTGGANLAGPDMTDMIYCNNDGQQINNGNDGGTTRPKLSTSASTWIIEENTGTKAAYAASKMQVGGADCVVSSTGVILSPLGNRLYPTGGNAATDFLRVWT